MKKNKKRVVIVLVFLLIFAIYLFADIRGDYLQTLAIGKEYLSVFEQNLKYKTNVLLISFAVLYIMTYITTMIIKKGLKTFFDEDKKEMPKLPNKSISLIFAVIASVIISNLLTEKIMLALNNTWFVINDPVFEMDIGYYMFQKPFIETLLIYFIAIIAIYIIYIAAYYIIAFNKFFDKGIDRNTLKNSKFIKQVLTSFIFIAIAGATLIFVKVQDVVYDKILTLTDGTTIYGAGSIDVIIKTWGYRIFAIVVLLCAIMIVIKFKQGKFKKIIPWVCAIPVYLVILFVAMFGFDLIYLNKNEFDKEKKYIEYNINFTQKAYNVNIEEIELENEGTITIDEISANEEVVNNVNLLNKTTTLSNLKQYQTNLGYYSYNNTKVGLYNINGISKLLYITPREILNNETRTYNNKTYEYTHGYGVIATSASNTEKTGGVQYIQNEFDETNNAIKINEPRIYFGMQTNEYIITKAKNKVEYDYPLTSTTNSSNTYEGTAGLKLNFLDRLILGIKEKDLKIAFSGNITNESKVITTRNIRERAKTIMPYLIYDEEPYIIATNDGDLLWVLDAYTVSDNYPYSQKSIMEYEGMKSKINYIRNSAKVLIDAYDGTVKFYITDRTDPIVMAYNKIYPGLFTEEQIPENISKHIVYSEYLYSIQANILKNYHNIQAEVLYRADDVWSIAKENITKTNNTSIGTEIKPYYTVVKTTDKNEAELGLVVPYTVFLKQNIMAYLVGTYDYTNNTQELKMYKFKSDNAVLGTTQLETLVQQDEKISKELETISVTGTKITKNIIIVPINNTLLYIEPIYQTTLNETIQVPILKKVIVASGNKVAIGDDLTKALKNLLSQEAISIEVDSENKDQLIEQIINANNNLKQSNTSNNWEMIGKDMQKLQNLIAELEVIINNETQEELEISDLEKTEDTNKVDVVNKVAE